MHRIFVAFALVAPLAAACTDSAVELEDELAAEEVVQIDDAKADLGGTSTYYQVQRDFRRCAAPFCGGYYYKLANAATTRCIDGKLAERCYAATADWSRLGEGGIGDGRFLLLRASIGRKNWGRDLGQFAELRPTEAWTSRGDNEPTGVFVKVEETGVRCFTKPCPTFREKKLNGSTTANLAEIGFEASGASQETINAAIDSMFLHDLIVVGDRYTVSGPGGRLPARTAVNFYTRVVEAPAKSCFVGGCSSQVCSDREGVITTCEFRPEYACYREATCEVQASGACGWTPTASLQACLASPAPL